MRDSFRNIEQQVEYAKDQCLRAEREMLAAKRKLEAWDGDNNKFNNLLFTANSFLSNLQREKSSLLQEKDMVQKNDNILMNRLASLEKRLDSMEQLLRQNSVQLPPIILPQIINGGSNSKILPSIFELGKQESSNQPQSLGPARKRRRRVCKVCNFDGCNRPFTKNTECN
ncbi:hypothetical protein HDV06_001052, partial [Boothiomyces sp. JEL0866]